MRSRRRPPFSLSSSSSLLTVLCQSITLPFTLISTFPTSFLLYFSSSEPLFYSTLLSSIPLLRPWQSYLYASLSFFISNHAHWHIHFHLLSFLCLFAHPPDCLLLSHPLSHLLSPSLFHSLHLPLLPWLSAVLPLPTFDLSLTYFPAPNLSVSLLVLSSDQICFSSPLLLHISRGFRQNLLFHRIFQLFIHPVRAACTASPL